MPIDLGKLLTVGQLAGNALSIPAKLQQGSQQGALDNVVAQMLLQQMQPASPAAGGAHGLPVDPSLAAGAGASNPVAQALQAQMGPSRGPIAGALDPSMHPGTYGKILAGVGDVGQIISAITGGDAGAAPPRIDASTLATIASMQNAKASREATAAYRDTQTGLGRERLDEDRRRTDLAHEDRQARTAKVGAGAGADKPTGDVWDRAITARAKSLGLEPGTQEYLDYVAKQEQGKVTGKAEAGIEPAKTKAGDLADIRAKIPPAVLRTMIGRAPAVKGLTDKVEADLAKIEAGPFASRFQELATGKGGLSNPDFFKLRTDATLLTSALTQMHVGSRPSEATAKKFDDMLGVNMQSPDNVRSALAAIREYADQLINEKTMPGEKVDTARPQAGESKAPGAAPELDDGFTVEFH